MSRTRKTSNSIFRVSLHAWAFLLVEVEGGKNLLVWDMNLLEVQKF